MLDLWGNYKRDWLEGGRSIKLEESRVEGFFFPVQLSQAQMTKPPAHIGCLLTASILPPWAVGVSSHRKNSPHALSSHHGASSQIMNA